MKSRRLLSAALLVAVSAAAGGCGSQSGAVLAPVAAPLAAPAVRAATPTAVSIDLDASSTGPMVSADVIGAEHATWFDFTQNFVNPSLKSAGIHLVRFPGGSESDAYHWANGGSLCAKMGYITPNGTFDNLMKDVAKPLGLDVAVTLNYGSNAACNGGGNPNEAKAWVVYAKSKGYRVAYWTVGNEVYGSWEYDLHASPHDPTTYANAVKTGYYPAVKAADANARLGVVVDTPNDTAWNTVVLKKAQPFDYVELHYYPQYNTDSDSFLLGKAIDNFGSDLIKLRQQMKSAGVPASTPIYLGEFNNDAGQEGKQSVSIVNGLYLGQMLATLTVQGVPMATWWLANGSCDTGGDYSKSLYGWQHFGSEALFSDGLPDPYDGCASVPAMPGGTPFPTARVMALFASSVPAGSSVRRTLEVFFTRSGSRPVVPRAYGYARKGGGYVFVVFNNTLSPVAATATVQNASKSSYDAALTVYGADQYDASKNNNWTGPVTKHLGTLKPKAISLTLPRYSISVLTLR